MFWKKGTNDRPIFISLFDFHGLKFGVFYFYGNHFLILKANGDGSNDREDLRIAGR